MKYKWCEECICKFICYDSRKIPKCAGPECCEEPRQEKDETCDLCPEQNVCAVGMA